jgi:hypothetical protein
MAGDDHIRFSFNALPGVELIFRPPTGFFGGWKVHHNGQVLKRKKGKLQLTHEGQTHAIAVKAGMDFFAPTFILGDEKVQPVPPLPTWLLIVAILPFGLVAVGGAIGGAFGGAAWAANLMMMRKVDSIPLKLFVALVTSAIAVAGWVGVAMVLGGLR